MMIVQTNQTDFSADVVHGWHFDPVAIATIAIGIVVMTLLTVMF
jgi:hypothetical protein